MVALAALIVFLGSLGYGPLKSALSNADLRMPGTLGGYSKIIDAEVVSDAQYLADRVREVNRGAKTAAAAYGDIDGDDPLIAYLVGFRKGLEMNGLAGAGVPMQKLGKSRCVASSEVGLDVCARTRHNLTVLAFGQGFEVDQLASFVEEAWSNQ